VTISGKTLNFLQKKNVFFI